MCNKSDLPAVFTILNNPGPGTYGATDGINTSGTYAESGHHRTRTPTMRKNSREKPTKYDRVPGADVHKPGPGWYDHKNQSLSMIAFKRALPMTKERLKSGFGSDSRKVFISNSSTFRIIFLITPSLF